MSKRLSLVAATLAGVFGPWGVSVAAPCIDIEKQISVDGGANYLDADDINTAGVVAIGTPAQYRFIIKNCGDVILDEVDVIDPALMIGRVDPGGNDVLEPVGRIPINGELILTGDADDTYRIPELAAAVRCTSPGEFMNTVTAVGTDEDLNRVTDSDSALLVCADDAAISIRKQVSVDGGQNYLDADEAANAPDVEPTGNVMYRFLIFNGGTVNLTSVTVSDENLLGTETFVVGDLAVNGMAEVTSADLPALTGQRCQIPGSVGNVATVTAEFGTSTVMDTNGAEINCLGGGNPMLELRKQISIDGGNTWREADVLGDVDVPVVTVDNSETLYRYILNNTGDVPFTEVDVRDLVLGIGSIVAGRELDDIGPGEEMTVMGDADRFPELLAAPRCTTAGTFINEASVEATGGVDQRVIVTNTAVLVCADGPMIRIKKQISVDGGNSYADADAPGDADVPVVEEGSGALYRFVVENVGMTDFAEVVISDAMLGIDFRVDLSAGPLGAGDMLTVTSTELPALEVKQRCDTPGTFINDAQVTARSVDGLETTASDMAVLRCEAARVPPPEDCTIAVDKTCVVNPDQGDECTVADHFDKESYSNSDGSKRWSTDWMEHDPFDKGPWSGQVAIEHGKLTLEDNPDTGTEPNAAREVDLSGATHASLSFDFATTRGVDNDDAVVVEVSGDGGTSYTVLKEFTHIHGATKGWEMFDISDFIASNTRVRFRVSNNYGYQDEYFLVDNVKITFNGCGAKPADPCTLVRGQSDEVEYRYMVTNTGNVDIRNISVEDDVLRTIPGSPIDSLAPQESVSLSQRAWVGHTVTNTVTVRGHTDNTDTSSCEAMDSATVTVGDDPDDSASDSDSDSGKDSDSDSGKDSDSDSGKDSGKDSDSDSGKDSGKDSDSDSDKDSGKDSDSDSDKDSGKDSDSDKKEKDKKKKH